MIKKLLLILLSLLLLLIIAYYFQPLKTGPGADPLLHYELVKDWPQLPANIVLGNPTGIGIDSAQNVFVFCRAGREWPLLAAIPTTYIKEKTILLIDGKSGKLLNSWGENLFIMPHGLTVDAANNVWVTDVGLHQVFKFSHEGKLLMKLGEAGVAGKDSAHFNQPTDVAVAADGCFYVSDGYGNSRVVKFSSTGQYLFEWGVKGTKEGQFHIPHGLALDGKGALYVADRENNRLQVFNANGKFLTQWAAENLGNICSVAYDKTVKMIIAVDDVSFLKMAHRGSDIIIFDTAGAVQTRFGRSGSYSGPKCWYHDVAVDKEGAIYVADILGDRLQKFSKTR